MDGQRKEDRVSRARPACTGFENIEIIERDPCPEVEYQSRRAYIFAKKPVVKRLQQFNKRRPGKKLTGPVIGM